MRMLEGVSEVQSVATEFAALEEWRQEDQE